MNESTFLETAVALIFAFGLAALFVDFALRRKDAKERRLERLRRRIAGEY